MYDIFIAHSKAEKETALALFNAPALQGHKPFLAIKSIPEGSDWDEVTQKAQFGSLITVALLSAASRNSHYTREELRNAIRMSRRDPERHWLIPVYVDGIPEEPEDYLYGMGLIQGVDLQQSGGVDGIAQLLADQLGKMRAGGGVVTPTVGGRRHVLFEYSLGPLVEGALIKRSVIEAYAKIIRTEERKLVVNEANDFRGEADPGTPYIIQLYKIASSEKVDDMTFWMDVFDYARRQGPRMLAALLLVVPDDLWDARAKTDRKNLLDQLRNYHQ